MSFWEMQINMTQCKSGPATKQHLAEVKTIQKQEKQITDSRLNNLSW